MKPELILQQVFIQLALKCVNGVISHWYGESRAINWCAEDPLSHALGSEIKDVRVCLQILTNFCRDNYSILAMLSANHSIRRSDITVQDKIEGHQSRGKAKENRIDLRKQIKGRSMDDATQKGKAKGTQIIKRPLLRRQYLSQQHPACPPHMTYAQ
jgi:hypothetical protein